MAFVYSALWWVFARAALSMLRSPARISLCGRSTALRAVLADRAVSPIIPARALACQRALVGSRHAARTTPDEVRMPGGALFCALFCDRRYGKVFAHHHGAGCDRASRGFRSRLQV